MQAQSIFEQVSQAIQIQAPNCNNTTRCLAGNHVPLCITEQRGSTPTFSTLAEVRVAALQPPGREAIPLSGRFTHFLASKAAMVQLQDKLDLLAAPMELFSLLFAALSQSSKLIHLAVQTQCGYTKYPEARARGSLGNRIVFACFVPPRSCIFIFRSGSKADKCSAWPTLLKLLQPCRNHAKQVWNPI